MHTINTNRKNILLIGATGFEPATYGTQNHRATKLRHAPLFKILIPRKPQCNLFHVKKS